MKTLGACGFLYGSVSRFQFSVGRLVCRPLIYEYVDSGIPAAGWASRCPLSRAPGRRAKNRLLKCSICVGQKHGPEEGEGESWLVLEEGLEPPRPFGTRDFESRASASSATPAVWKKGYHATRPATSATCPVRPVLAVSAGASRTVGGLRASRRN